MTHGRTKKSNKNQYKQSKLQENDIQFVVMSEQKLGKKKQKRRVQQKQAKPLSISKLMQPKNQIDQIRLQHIQSKIKQASFNQNQSYQKRICEQFEIYRNMILEFTDIPVNDRSINYKQMIINEFIKQSKIKFSSQQIKLKQIDYIEISQQNNNLIMNELLSKIDYGNARLRLDLQKKSQISQLSLIQNNIIIFREQLIQQNQQIVKQVIEQQDQYYPQLLQEQVKEIREQVQVQNIVIKQLELNSLFKYQELDQTYKLLQQLLLAPSFKPIELLDNCANQHQFQIFSKQVISKSRMSNSLNRIPSIQQSHNMNSSLPFRDVTPMNPKKTMLVSEQPILKTAQGLKELNQFNYTRRNCLKDCRDNQQQVCLRNIQANYEPEKSQCSFSSRVSQQNFDPLQFSNLYKSSLQASTIHNNNEFTQSKLIYNDNVTHVNWVYFVNELSPFKFPHQVQHNHYKFACIPIDNQLFDEHELVLVNDQCKVMILEQKDIMTPDVHMKLNRNDDQGAIKLVTLKLQFLTQQFMISHNKRIIVILQYENQFFYHLVNDYVLNYIDSVQLILFSQFEELKGILIKLIQPKSYPFQIIYDQQKLRNKVQLLEYHEQLRLKSQNQIYQTLLNYVKV